MRCEISRAYSETEPKPPLAIGEDWAGRMTRCEWQHTYAEEGELVDGLAGELEPLVNEIEASVEKWKDMGQRGSGELHRADVVCILC